MAVEAKPLECAGIPEPLSPIGSLMTEPVINHAGSNNETFSLALTAQRMIHQELTANAQPSLAAI